ncbi:MAG: methylated-DNA--[protein]-cysteine S-methyltransferase [Myxococcaceae bacterium]|nr:methylated-DNA--[protein]-cysteine S-methyltransferase [Myxococcaceae bacterium]
MSRAFGRVPRMSEHAWSKTRLGWLSVTANEAGLTRLVFAEKPPKGHGRGGPFTHRALEAIERYFAGELNALDALTIAPAGTAFQKLVWAALRTVRAGATLSYAELADRLGRPRAVRAVGQANAKNPIALVVPCHRVVSSDGSLGGYAWGADRKAWLLAHENVARLLPRPRASKPTARRAEAPLAALPLFERLAEPGLHAAP